MSYLGPSWTLDEHLSGIDTRLLATREGRVELCRLDPLLFCLVYLPHHLKGPETGDALSFSRFHLDMYREARGWLRPATRPREQRTAFVAPRGAGKSTMAFLGLPMWAGAYGHIDFVAAFAHTGPQAELHLQTFKRELDTNELLRHDFPDLVTPATRPGGATVSDNRGFYMARGGFVFAAKGMDSASLGLKVGQRRPRLLLFDDIEPDESNYSAYQKEKRLSTLLEAVLELNIYARVLLVGTTTMHGSVMHDIVRQVTEPDECPEWVADEQIVARYYPAIVVRDDGVEVSLWPEKWPIEFLQAIRRTRSYAKNYDNRPVNVDGDYWSEEDFRYDVPDGVTARILSIDPATTSKNTSDYTGLAVIGWSPMARRCVVLHTAQVKLTPAKLREHCLRVYERFRVTAVLIETNQGGDTWDEILRLPGTSTIHNTTAKEVRAAECLDHYQSGLVAHDGRQPAFEGQALAFPAAAHDDVVDAVVNGVNRIIRNGRGAPRRATSTTYA